MILLPLLPFLLPAQDSPIQALIISGANNHDWEWTSPSIERLLEAGGHIEAEITYAPAEDLADPARLAAVDVVVLDYNGPRWGEPAETNFLNAVRGGLGVSVVHAANNAFPGWEAYESLVCHCWREGTGHGRFHPFTIRIDNRDHPITRSLPTLIEHEDELYHRLMHMHGCGFDQLASAFSAPETGGTGQDEPMILVRMEGEGRVFHTPLGHVWKGQSHASHEDPQFGELLRRGTEWAATGDVRDGTVGANALTEDERAAGWRLLFNGRDLYGWKGRGGKEPGPGWQIAAGCIRRSAEAGDLLTQEQFTNFELTFDFEIAAGTNSGVKYRVNGADLLGPEYQVLDDARHEAEGPTHRCGALYDLIAPDVAPFAGAAAWHRARIVARGSHLEHWLDGRLLLSIDTRSEAFATAKAASKFKGEEAFGLAAPGAILLQDHGGEVWYRNLKLRSLDDLVAQEVDLLASEGLSAWIETGDADYTRHDRTIVGRVAGGGQSFLRTDREFSDFVFETEVFLEVPGNSGIQFRSYLKNGERVCGYQAEIDPSPRSWSGGLFEECENWLDGLSEDAAARAAFHVEDWNHYRIECRGEHLRIWVNGIPTADHLDGRHRSGFLALQVHSGKQGVIHWRNPRLWTLGE